jgi:hypothetical protein
MGNLPLSKACVENSNEPLGHHAIDSQASSLVQNFEGQIKDHENWFVFIPFIGEQESTCRIDQALLALVHGIALKWSERVPSAQPIMSGRQITAKSGSHTRRRKISPYLPSIALDTKRKTFIDWVLGNHVNYRQRGY